MMDSEGKPLQVGARVICDGMQGEVVCSIDTGEGTSEAPIEQWSHLRRGVMIRTKKAGLIHYTDGSGIVQISD